MAPTFPFLDFAFGDIFNSILPDFVLAFTFFTAVVYAVLSRHFGDQRPAVAMSAALGMALSVGLVWWEYANGYSIRDLGPIAVGFATVILAGVIYQSIRGVGGNWAGAGIAIGACLLIGWTLGLDRHVDRGIIQSLVTVLLTVGVIAFLLHRHGNVRGALPAFSSLADARHDMSDLYKDERVAHKLNHDLKHLKREARHLAKHPDEGRREASDIMVQLKRILPAEGWLTERMARLRTKMHLAGKGAVERIEGLQKQFGKLPPKARQAAAENLRNAYTQLHLDRRLERLDAAVAENERRIRDLMERARQYMEAHDYPRLATVLEEASRLQKHNTKLFAIIDHTEARLLHAGKQALRHNHEVKNA